MKILVYSCHFGDPIGIGKFSSETAHWLASQGHEVRVIAAPPYYPQWRLTAGRWAARYSVDRTNEFMILRCPIWIPSRPAAFLRILHYAIFALASLPPLFWWCLVWRPKVVWIVVPPLMCVPGALIGGFISRGLIWLHVQDLEVDAAFELGFLRNRILRSLILGIERFLMARVHVTSAVSAAMVATLKRKKIRRTPILFQNWVDTDLIFPMGKSPLREQLSSGASFLALYSGNLGRKQGLEMIIEVAELLRDRPEVRIVVSGEGVSHQQVAEAAARLPNISLLPLVPFSELNWLLNAADVHLLPQRDEVTDLVMPSKLGGMLASGRPVIAAARPQTQLAEEIVGAGIVVPPGDARAMADAICRLHEQPGLKKELSVGARARAIAYWSKRRILCEFENRLQAEVVRIS